MADLLRITKYYLEISIQGVDMLCPLCKALIISGETHRCSSDEPLKKRKAVKRG